MPRPRVLDQPARVTDPGGRAVCRRRRMLYAVTSVVLTLIVGLAAVEGLWKVPVYGVTTPTARAVAPDGTGLEVRYGRVVRGALASALDVIVTKPGGFGGEVRVSVTRDYFDLFRTTAVTPQPATVVSSGGVDVYTFAAPPGHVLAASWQNEASPLGWFTRRVATVAVLDAAGDVVVHVDVTTELRP